MGNEDQDWKGRAFVDLREFIDEVDRLGGLKKISGAHWDLEIGGITEAAARRSNPKLLLFDDIPDYPDFRLATNVLDKHAPWRERLVFNVPLDLSDAEAIRYWKRQLRDKRSIPPRQVDDGPINEIVLEGDDADLTKLPWVRWHSHDGGRYMSATSAVTRDLEGGFYNVGSYRFMLVDETTFVGHLASGHHGDVIRKKYWAEGKSCPISLALGFDPVLLIAAGENLPWGEDEYGYAGWIRGEPIDVVPGAYTGFPVPATAEVVIEAEMLPPEEGTAIEGPFGEATGYYGGGAHPSSLMKVKSIMMRRNPIVMGAPPIFHTARNLLADRGVLTWDELERLGIPGIKGVSKLLGLTIISVEQSHPGHAMRAALGALGGIAGYYGKFIVLVDEDIDPFNFDEVMWAIATRTDPQEDIDIVRRTWTNRIDPRLEPSKRDRGDLTASVAIIDATRPYYWRKQFPPTTAIDEETRRATEQKWGAILDE